MFGKIPLRSSATAQLNAKASLTGATFTGGVNLARSSVVQHATTMNLWALSNTIDGTGSAVIITAIANAPQRGTERTLYPIVGTVITNNAMFNVQGNANYTTKADDALVFTATEINAYHVDIVPADGMAIAVVLPKQLQPITATANAGALTISLLPTTLDYRSATLSSGAITQVTNAATLTTVISSGSTAGGTSTVPLRIIILGINAGGVTEIAWINIAGGNNLEETGVITTVAEGGAGAADSANVFYSTTARTGVTYRVIGLADVTNTVAGTWLPPTLVQGIGGQAGASLALNASGLAPMFACRAWVNFNGTGTVAIRGSGNVSSITDSGVGFYTVNFTTAMLDVNYSVTGTAGIDTPANSTTVLNPYTYAASNFILRTVNGAGTATDFPWVSIGVFR